MPIPPLNYAGYLPEGIHETNLDQLRERFAIGEPRVVLWGKFIEFLDKVQTHGGFSYAYIDGGFVTGKPDPSDIDVILQTASPWGTLALESMTPFFAFGLSEILNRYQVHLHFWSEGFPGGASDFRLFFQYFRPQDAAPLGLREQSRKGIVRITL